MLKTMLTKRIYYRGAITAYYKGNDSIIRYPMFKTDEKNVSKVRYQLKECPLEYDAFIENSRIDELETKINQAIVDILKLNPQAKITIAKVKDVMGTVKIDSKGIVDDLTLFINRRLEEMRKENPSLEEEFPSGLKDYRSLKNVLLDYQHDEDKILQISDIDEDFISDFSDYLFDKRPENKENDDYKYKSKGNLANKTMNKRLESFSAFLRAFHRNEKLAALISSYRYRLDENDVIRITKDELIKLAEVKIKKETEKRIRDYFVFICLTGVRFSDLIRIDKQNFSASGKETSLRIKTQKTQKTIEVPLNKRAREIAKKYDYSFKAYTNQVFNRMLKELLESQHLFEDEITISKAQRKQTNDYICKRREVISAHTGRRTFISILVEQGMPLQMIMSMTGHTQVKTLQIYIDKFSPEKRKYMDALDF